MENVLHRRACGIGRDRQTRDTGSNLGSGIGRHGFDFSQSALASRGNARLGFGDLGIRISAGSSEAPLGGLGGLRPWRLRSAPGLPRAAGQQQPSTHRPALAPSRRAASAAAISAPIFWSRPSMVSRNLRRHAPADEETTRRK
jgi:hypothetical protein